MNMRTMKSLRYAVVLGVAVSLIGCSQVTETGKSVWGSSTAALEQARVNALRRTYVCTMDECFDVVLSLANNEEALKPETEKFFDVFLKDRRKAHIVVMGIAGNVDTTEVGIFFDDMGQDTTRIEISSLSSSAKTKVARAIFEELDLRFPTL